MLARNITGERFGRLVAVMDGPRANDDAKQTVCWCDCGNTIIVRNQSLRTKNTQSCGCLLHEVMVERNFVHGLSRTPLYKREHKDLYREEHAEEIKTYEKEYRKLNYSKILDKNANYRARVRDAFVEDVDRQVVFERDKGICGICDTAVIGKFDIDHIIPTSKGGEHSYVNTRVTHPLCNQEKHDKAGF